MFKYLLVLLIFLLSSGQVRGSAELSGSWEIGDKTFSEILLEELEDEVVDEYTYQRFWLRYKVNLSGGDYYYWKVQYYAKDYLEKETYNNQAIDLLGNYTYEINSNARNKWYLTFRNKDYQQNSNLSYNLLRLKYELDYRYGDKHKYNFYLQRQWEDYFDNPLKDNIYDKLSLSWQYELRENLDLTTQIQLDRELYEPGAESDNKYGKKFSLSFKYDLE